MFQGSPDEHYASQSSSTKCTDPHINQYQMSKIVSYFVVAIQVIVAALRKRDSIIHDSVAVQEIGAVCVDREENLHNKR